MWRKTPRGLTVCNVCHLKRVKSAGGGASLARQKEKSKELVRQSSRKSRPSSKVTKVLSGKLWDRSIKTPGLRNRKAAAKKKVNCMYD